MRLGRVSKGLVIAEIAVSCGLLVAAGLMMRSVVNVTDFDFGFSTEKVFTAGVGLLEGDYPAEQDRRQFFQELVRRLSGQPGVHAAALTSHLPVGGGLRLPLSVGGVAYADELDHPQVRRVVVTPRYFDVLGVGPTRGRLFRSTDATDTAPMAIVNEHFVELFVPNGDPEPRRDFTVLEPLDVMEHEDRPIAVRELGERALKVDTRRGSRRRVDGVVRSMPSIRIERGAAAVDPYRPAAHVVERAVDYDSMQPRPERRLAVERLEPAMCQQEHLLEQVLGVGAGRQHPKQEPIELGSIGVVHLAKRPVSPDRMRSTSAVLFRTKFLVLFDDAGRRGVACVVSSAASGSRRTAAGGLGRPAPPRHGAGFV